MSHYDGGAGVPEPPKIDDPLTEPLVPAAVEPILETAAAASIKPLPPPTELPAPPPPAPIPASTQAPPPAPPPPAPSGPASGKKLTQECPLCKAPITSEREAISHLKSVHKVRKTTQFFPSKRKDANALKPPVPRHLKRDPTTGQFLDRDAPPKCPHLMPMFGGLSS